MLELNEIEKAYHSRLVLQKTSLQLQNGIYWVKGENGSGKTTLLKMMAGLMPFKGDILFNNISQNKNPVSYRKNVSWAEAEPMYPDFISGKDLIFLYRDIRKADQHETNRLLDFFDLAEYSNDPVGTYSAGMIKRLSLVLAFIGNFSLCILDEPFITLDAGMVELVSSYIMQQHKNKGTMFLMSSHQEVNTHSMKFDHELMIADQNVSLCK